jgi:hypothetical protein
MPLYRAEARAGQNRYGRGKVAMVELSSHRGGNCVCQVAGGGQSGELFFWAAVELSEVVAERITQGSIWEH